MLLTVVTDGYSTSDIPLKDGATYHLKPAATCVKPSQKIIDNYVKDICGWQLFPGESTELHNEYLTIQQCKVWGGCPESYTLSGNVCYLIK